MEFSKICSSGSVCMLAPQEIAKNRYEQFTFSTHFDRKAIWNSLDQKLHSVISTALRITLVVPIALFAIEIITRVVQAAGNTGIFMMNFAHGVFSKHEIEVLEPITQKEPSIEKLVSKEDQKNPTVGSNPSTDDELISFNEVFIPVMASQDETSISDELSQIESTPSPQVTVSTDDDDWETNLENPAPIQIVFEEPAIPPAPENKPSYFKTGLIAAAGVVVLSVAAYFGSAYFADPASTGV